MPYKMEENTEIEYCEICNEKLELEDEEVVHMECLRKIMDED